MLNSRFFRGENGHVCFSGDSKNPVQRADHPPAAPVEEMGVDHGGGNIDVAQQFLDGADVVAAIKIYDKSPPQAAWDANIMFANLNAKRKLTASMSGVYCTHYEERGDYKKAKTGWVDSPSYQRRSSPI